MRRILFYVHFNAGNQLAEHVVYQLRQMRPLFDKVVLISNSEFKNEDLNRLYGLYDEFIQRENRGFDFGAWRDGMKSIGWSDLKRYDSVTFMNDTCYGPVFDLAKYYNKFESDKKIDFWGGTLRPAFKNGMPRDNGPVFEHIQSYFVVYKKQIVGSEIFQKTWNSVKDFDDVTDVIRNYETQFTRMFSEAGFNYDAIYKIKGNDWKNVLFDELHLAPEVPIRKNFPFIKKKAAYLLNFRSLRKELVKAGSDYPVRLIQPMLGGASTKIGVKLIARKILGNNVYEKIKKIVKRT